MQALMNERLIERRRTLNIDAVACRKCALLADMARMLVMTTSRDLAAALAVIHVSLESRPCRQNQNSFHTHFTHQIASNSAFRAEVVPARALCPQRSLKLRRDTFHDPWDIKMTLGHAVRETNAASKQT